MSCIPTGMPLSNPNPTGSEMAGSPARLAGTVMASAAYPAVACARNGPFDPIDDQTRLPRPPRPVRTAEAPPSARSGVRSRSTPVCAIPRARPLSPNASLPPPAPPAPPPPPPEKTRANSGDDAPNPLRPVEVPRRDVGAEDVRADEHAPLDLGAETAGSSARGGLVKTLSPPRGDENPLSTRFEPRCLTSSQFAVSRGTVPTVRAPFRPYRTPSYLARLLDALRGGQDVVRGERGGGARQRHGRHRRAQPLQQLARLAPRGSDLV